MSLPWVQIGLGLAVVAAVAWIVYLAGKRMNVVQAARMAEAEAREVEELRSRQEARMPGGSPTHPIEVASAAVIEPRAASLPCPRCGSPAHVDEHAVEAHAQGEQRLRVTRMRCGTCGHRRPLYFLVRSSAADDA
jgi:DNA-directed RNA polymerase subunit M/transcription elongation factor TFIIS